MTFGINIAFLGPNSLIAQISINSFSQWKTAKNTASSDQILINFTEKYKIVARSSLIHFTSIKGMLHQNPKLHDLALKFVSSTLPFHSFLWNSNYNLRNRRERSIQSHKFTRNFLSTTPSTPPLFVLSSRPFFSIPSCFAKHGVCTLTEILSNVGFSLSGMIKSITRIANEFERIWKCSGPVIDLQPKKKWRQL